MTTMPIELLPVLIFFAGALAVAFIGGRGAAAIAVLTPLVAGWSAWQTWPGEATFLWPVMDYHLSLRLDGMALVFAGLFHVAALLAAIYALGHGRRLELAAMLGYCGAGMGAVLAGDWLTLFIFWELIALNGVLLVWAGGTSQAVAAGIRYLVFQVTSGVTLLGGILWYGSTTGSFEFGQTGLAAPGAWMILIACGIKTGFPLLHSWIVDAYPRSTAMGSAILVAVTTKVGIYVLARAFAGEALLVWVGLIMALWPLFYAMVENDLRRVLAYTLMVQLGVMVAAIGVGSDLALDGVTMHVVMDVLFKMLLFMVLGVVLLRAGTTRASELGGLARMMPVTTALLIVGVLANAGMPGTGAFESKKLLMASLEYGGYTGVWLVMMSLSGLGMLYIGLRVVWQGFFQEPAEPRQVREAPWPMLLAMGLIVAGLLVAGFWPALTDGLRVFGSTYDPFNGLKIVGQLQLLVWAVLAYVLLSRIGLGVPAPRDGAWLDSEWIYRRAIPATAGRIRNGLGRLRDLAWHVLTHRGYRAGDGRLSDTLSKSWPTGSMALWVAVLLAVLLVFGLGEN